MYDFILIPKDTCFVRNMLCTADNFNCVGDKIIVNYIDTFISSILILCLRENPIHIVLITIICVKQLLSKKLKHKDQKTTTFLTDISLPLPTNNILFYK